MGDAALCVRDCGVRNACSSIAIESSLLWSHHASVTGCVTILQQCSSIAIESSLLWHRLFVYNLWLWSHHASVTACVTAMQLNSN